MLKKTIGAVFGLMMAFAVGMAQAAAPPGPILTANATIAIAYAADHHFIQFDATATGQKANSPAIAAKTGMSTHATCLAYDTDDPGLVGKTSATIGIGDKLGFLLGKTGTYEPVSYQSAAPDRIDKVLASNIRASPLWITKV